MCMICIIFIIREHAFPFPFVFAGILASPPPSVPLPVPGQLNIYPWDIYPDMVILDWYIRLMEKERWGDYHLWFVLISFTGWLAVISPTVLRQGATQPQWKTSSLCTELLKSSPLSRTPRTGYTWSAGMGREGCMSRIRSTLPQVRCFILLHAQWIILA